MANVLSVEARRLTAATYELAEGPVWLARTSRLAWVDIHAGQLWSAPWEADVLSPEAVLSVSTSLGAALPCSDGGWILAAGDHLEHRDRQGRPTRLELPGQPIARGARFNDAACDPAGRLLAGTMSDHDAAGVLYQVDRNKVRRVLDGVGISNGLGWSPDGATLYYADSATGTVEAFDYEVATGALANRRAFVQIEASDGVPDGLTVDASGCVWVAIWGAGQVRGFTTHGVLNAVVEVPTPHVSSCAFAGPDLRDLVITTAWQHTKPGSRARHPSAGALFVADALTTPGLPQHVYAC